MHSLEVVGPFKGSTGYDRHTREFVRQLVRLGLRVQLTHLEGWSAELPLALREAWFEELRTPVEADTVLHFTMPSQARARPGRRNVNYTMFEADRIPASWAACSAGHQRIILPTESSRRAWLHSGVAGDRLRLCPLGVDGKFFATRVAPLPLTLPDGSSILSRRYRFLNIADLRPRKNHLGLLRSWIRATSRNDDAVLILKCPAVPHQHLDLWRGDISRMERSLGQSLREAAPVLFLFAYLTEGTLRSLYSTATHYISMSRGEGWDQPMMEAAVAGLQLIAPNHSAYTSYLCQEDAELIPAAIVPVVFDIRVGQEDRLWFEGAQWWQPDEDAAVAIIRRILRGDASTKLSPQQRLCSEYSWEKAARQLLTILREQDPEPQKKSGRVRC